MPRSSTVHAIVLKRTSFGEADLIVTFYSQELGKVVALAKGVRKISSRRASSLEPAMYGKYALINGKAINTLTETQIIKNLGPSEPDLANLTRTQQVLEIIDLLTVDHEPNSTVFDLLKSSLLLIRAGTLTKTVFLENIRLVLQALGFTHDKQFSERGLKEYVEELANKKLKTKSFLTIPQARG